MRIEFTLDCSDLARMARFWEAAAGFVVGAAIEGHYVTMTREEITLTLQHVPEPKIVKNRMHLDLLVDDLDPELRRLESLGATRVEPGARNEFGQTWYVLADPEGNEFCIARSPQTASDGEPELPGGADA